MKNICPHCGIENKEGAKFCSNCNEPSVTPNISINKQNINIKRIVKEEGLKINKKTKVNFSNICSNYFFLCCLYHYILFFRYYSSRNDQFGKVF